MEQQTKPVYLQSVEEVFNEVQSSPAGLSSQEVASRLEKYGANTLQEGKKKSLLEKFVDQFKDFMILVLLVAAVVSMFAHSGEPDPTDAVIILAVVLLNAILGVFQESKAEEAIEALKKMASPVASVLRDGHVEHVKGEDIVVGDIVILEAGDVVPADMRLFEVNTVKIEESALTGESVPVDKDLVIPTGDEVGIGDRTNMAFSSTNVTYGRAVGVVTSTGMNTEVGKIANMLANTEEGKTPLQENQDALGKWLTIMILVIAVIIFVVGMLRGNEWTHMLLTAIAIAVAAIPEGLPAISTIILALGTQKMAQRNALVRKLPAVETLGGVEIICSDKTGTLTLNQMTVEKMVYDNEIHDASEEISKDNMALRVMNLANDTKISQDNSLLGDPTETAMVQYGLDKKYDVREELVNIPRVAEVPFDSTRKLMTTIHQLEDGKYLVATKGAPDMLLERVTKIEKHGEVSAFTEDDRTTLMKLNKEMATQALRVLAMAYKVIDTLPETIDTDSIEHDLIFSGLVGMIDPERKEAAAAIKVAQSAGIRTIMITGDHRDTAQAIAKRLGILRPDQEDGVLTGGELNDISDEELERTVETYSVYARVSPEHKVRIVKAWQKNGKVVSMTGDGVNDAPSLKQADIGVGMGITGTEVSKGASDMVLADDNFETIVVAVEEGRKVFSNIQKAVQYLLSANFGEVMTMFVATMAGWSILEPIHILWINLVTDVFPAIALGLEEAEADIMNHPPRGKSSNFLSNGVLPSIFYQGFFEGGITLFVFWYATHIANWGNPVGETMAFATLGLIQLFHAFNVKSVYKSLGEVGAFKNKMFNYAILLSAVMLLSVMVIPGLTTVFDVATLTAGQWLFVVGSAFSIVPIVEIAKAIMRAMGMDKD
ncbi:cation-translocating P-type ATPase [Granulicatella adiacens ATCC 49175]|uniref:P-type Ca(2+) transporter n=2 Tax=Granulicatella TaxID=117563 RepID=C8NGG2_9LACT|nr:cation-translocating P-type ATPase [Granulicatella adiacens]EEW37220.1 putative potassium/sodium efflux P-type ATPase, fungal-type [Granulicatella adiacens ATCC 49175]UWP38665.1 cation-translocating P-type ATPase [Granulicatella adiacens ATCC 49175]